LLRAVLFVGCHAAFRACCGLNEQANCNSAFRTRNIDIQFSAAQATLSLLILRLPRAYASLLLGGTGLALTLVALSLAAVITQGVALRSVESWVAATIVVWLITTIGAIVLPEVLVRDPARFGPT
jgi:hypothetical protein